MVFKIDIIAPGRMKNSPWSDLWADYQKRCTWAVSLYEIDARPDQECRKILEKVRDDAYVIALDEQGQAITSSAFAAKLQTLIDTGTQTVQFIIGGADGLDDAVKKRADYLVSFGIQTWPHIMVRVMLMEQIYRARQINTGHPYHRS